MRNRSGITTLSEQSVELLQLIHLDRRAAGGLQASTMAPTLKPQMGVVEAGWLRGVEAPPPAMQSQPRPVLRQTCSWTAPIRERARASKRETERETAPLPPSNEYQGLFVLPQTAREATEDNASLLTRNTLLWRCDAMGVRVHATSAGFARQSELALRTSLVHENV